MALEEIRFPKVGTVILALKIQVTNQYWVTESTELIWTIFFFNEKVKYNKGKTVIE